VVASAQSAGDARRDAWRRLLAFEGQDLWKLEGEPREAVAALANRLVPDGKEPGSFGYDFFRPRLFERIETADGPRLVLLVSPTLLIMPGQQWHRLHLFDEAGSLRGSSDFSSGWRTYVNEVQITARGGVKAPLLKMSVSGYPQRAAAEYYALLGDRAVLVRLEGRDGKPVRNAYGCPYPSTGPPAPRRTAEEWARALASADAVEVLQALTWVGGRHESLEDLKEEQEQERRMLEAYHDPPESSSATLDRCPGAADDAVLYEAVRAREDVRLWLGELSKSKDAWVRQAAELALTPWKWNE
jgi:hypothetical protein